FMLIFGIITFGIAFMQLQTARGAVREGARTGAVYDGTKWKAAADMKTATVDASSGLIRTTDTVTTQACTAAGGQSKVSYDTRQANGGTGIVANLIFFQVPMNSTVTAQFLCEG